jgi:NADH dehydrogenase [ubiquinone] 1 alpha subcomplex assembly factor 5
MSHLWLKMATSFVLRPFLQRCVQSRSMAVLAPVSRESLAPFQVFDRRVKEIQKDRASARDGGEQSRTVDYIRNEVAERLNERLLVRELFDVLLQFEAYPLSHRT